MSTVFASGSTDTINRESYQNKKPSLFAINGDTDYIPSDADDNNGQVEQKKLHQSAPSASSQFSSNKRKLSQMDFDDTISINTQQLVKKKFVTHRDQDAKNHQSHEKLNELMSENCHSSSTEPIVMTSDDSISETNDSYLNKSRSEAIVDMKLLLFGDISSCDEDSSSSSDDDESTSSISCHMTMAIKRTANDAALDDDDDEGYSSQQQLYSKRHKIMDTSARNQYSIDALNQSNSSSDSFSCENVNEITLHQLINRMWKTMFKDRKNKTDAAADHHHEIDSLDLSSSSSDNSSDDESISASDIEADRELIF